ncbi:MAG: hypothetical protein AAGF50_08490 [Pseudomonadota bacterium]
MTERQAKIAVMYIDEIMAEIESIAALVAAVRHDYDPGGSPARREDKILADLGFIERRCDLLSSLSADAAADVLRARVPKLTLVKS